MTPLRHLQALCHAVPTRTPMESTLTRLRMEARQLVQRLGIQASIRSAGGNIWHGPERSAEVNRLQE